MITAVSVSFLALAQLGHVLAGPVARDVSGVNVTSCKDKTYVYEGLAGWGLLPSDARDKFGDTIGGIGSAIALDTKSWKRKTGDGNKEAYEGILYGLPDRGWNTQGTQNTQGRAHKFEISLEIVDATLQKPAQPNFEIKYLDTILLTGPDGTPTSGTASIAGCGYMLTCPGLDADVTGTISFNGFPDLPVVHCKLATVNASCFG